MKELRVSALENGTVIDHIPPESVFQVVKILGLEHSDNMILIGTHLESKKIGSKGVIKVRNRNFKRDEINKISLVAPQASLVIIKNYDVVDKYIVEIPDEIVGIAKCFNPKCISNHEELVTKFAVIDKNNLKLKCHYCEKITEKQDLKVIR